MNEIMRCEDRLKSMIVLDKQETPQKINKIIKSEVLFVLKNYFDMSAEDLSVDIEVSSSGKYQLSIRGESRDIKIAHVFSR